MGQIDQRLAELDIALPAAAKPVANYVPWVRTGNLVFISGQGPIADGKITLQGCLGDFAAEDGVKSARLSAINVLAQLKDACGGDLDRVTRIVKLDGFVNATAAFTDHPKVINGASNPTRCSATRAAMPARPLQHRHFPSASRRKWKPSSRSPDHVQPACPLCRFSYRAPHCPPRPA